MEEQDRDGLPQQTPEDLVSVRAAARASGVSAAAIYYGIQRGRVAVYPGQRQRLISLAVAQALALPPDPHTPTDAVTIQEAARLTGVARNCLFGWVKQGRLPRWRGRHGNLVRVADARALARHDTAPPALGVATPSRRVATWADPPMPPDALLIGDVARLTGVAKVRIYTWVKRGLAPAWPGTGSGQRVRLSDITALAERPGRPLSEP